MMLPMIIRLKVKSDEKRGINLFLPMLVIYILLLPFVLLAIPLWLLYSLFAADTGKGKMVFQMVPAAFALLCATRGTEVIVDDNDSVVKLKIM